MAGSYQNEVARGAFHRTLKFEILSHFNLRTLPARVRCLSRSLQPGPSARRARPGNSRFLLSPRPSPIPFLESLLPVEYPAGLVVRKVQAAGWFSYRSQAFRLPSST